MNRVGAKILATLAAMVAWFKDPSAQSFDKPSGRHLIRVLETSAEASRRMKAARLAWRDRRGQPVPLIQARLKLMIARGAWIGERLMRRVGPGYSVHRALVAAQRQKTNRLARHPHGRNATIRIRQAEVRREAAQS